MKKIKIRFNTECKNKDEQNSLCWRALIDDQEFLATDIEINVPTKTVSHIVDGVKKWSIYCESNNYYFDDNKKLTINNSKSVKQKALFIGRFQPFHSGHQWLLETKLNAGVPILIAIRDVEPDEKNPLTAQQSASLIRKVYEGKDVTVIIIPDIESVNWGRGVGYATIEHIPPTDIANISATQIRNQIASGSEEWKKIVDPKIWDDVIALLKAKHQ